MIDLSVHLMTYNSESYILETLESIVMQKVKFKYEVVVSDDCSTDKTYDIITNFAEKYPKLFKVSQNKSQLGILRNYKKTLDQCRGTYIFDIAGDDYLKSANALQEMINVFEENPAVGFIDCGYDKLFEDTKKVQTFTNKLQISLLNQDYKRQAKLGNIYPIGYCYRRKYLYQYVDFETYLNMGVNIEDYPIIMDLVMNTEFTTLNKSLVVYRVHPESYSNKENLEQRLTNVNHMRDLFEYFAIKYNFSKRLKETYFKNFHRQLLYLAYCFGDKTLGKNSFAKIKNKSLLDFFYYLLSKSAKSRRMVLKIKKQLRIN